eukprot:COSAG01_NODE_16815_length_1201_cov_2.035390_1_plen_209_part_10
MVKVTTFTHSILFTAGVHLVQQDLESCGRYGSQRAKMQRGGALPDGWQTKVSETTGHTYYVNLATGETSWDPPSTPSSSSSSRTEGGAGGGGPLLSPGWSTCTSRSSGETYFVNEVTQESTFERPTESALPFGWQCRQSRSTGEPYIPTPLTPPIRPPPSPRQPPPPHATMTGRGSKGTLCRIGSALTHPAHALLNGDFCFAQGDLALL